MGSFNTSCFVTQQIIQPGDEAVLFPIVQQRGYSPVAVQTDSTRPETTPIFGYTSSTCHQNSFWDYAGPTLEGVYDDYGKFLLVDTPQNKKHILVFFESLHSHLCDVKAGENEHHDHPLSFRDLFEPIRSYDFESLQSIWDVLSDLAQEHRLFFRVYGRSNEVRPLAFAVAHRSAFDQTQKMMEEYSDWSRTAAPLEDAVRTAITKEYTDNVELLKLGGKATGLMRIHARKLESAELINAGRDFRLDLHYPLDDMDLFSSVYGAGSLDKAVAVFLEHRRGLCEHLYFCGGLELVGVRLSPQVYAGQDYDNEGGNLFLTLVQRVNQDVNKQIADRDEG